MLKESIVAFSFGASTSVLFLFLATLLVADRILYKCGYFIVMIICFMLASTTLGFCLLNRSKVTKSTVRSINSIV